MFMRGVGVLLLGVVSGQPFFTNPTEFGVCQACCQEAFAGDNVNINSCAQIGCGTVQNCFNQGDQTQACLGGRDFRFLGATKIAGTDFSCDENGLSDVNFDFNDANNKQFVDEDSCRSCCDDLNDNFDFDGDDILGLNFCRNTCGNAGRDCLGEGNSKDRLGCSIASDFLVQGSSQYTVNQNKVTVDDPFPIFCSNGLIALNQNNGGDNNNNGNDDVKAALIPGLIAGGLVFALAFVFMLYRNQSRKQARGSFGQVTLKFGENPATYASDFKIRPQPVAEAERKASYGQLNRAGSKDNNDFGGLNTPPAPAPEKVLRRSPAPQEVSNKFGVFTGIHNAVKRLAPGGRETTFNIRVGDQDLSLQPVEANVGRNERGRRVSGLAPPSKKIWSIGARTKSLFSTTTTKRATVQTDIHENMNPVERKQWTPFGATSFNMRVGGGKNVVVPNFTSQKIPVEPSQLQQNLAVRGPTQIQQLQTEQYAGGLESTRRLSGQDNFRPKISNSDDMGYGLRQQSSNYNERQGSSNYNERQGSSNYNYEGNNSYEYGRQESRNQRKRRRKRKDKNEDSKEEDIWDY